MKNVEAEPTAAEPPEEPEPKEEKPQPTREEIEAAGQSVALIRQTLALVSFEVLEGTLHSIGVDEVMAPLLDPTKYMRQNQARNFSVQKAALRKLIELKRVWGHHEGRV